METIKQPDTHVTEELLEQYVLGRLTPTRTAVISEHLFDCDSCYAEYEDTVNFIGAMRDSTPELRDEVVQPTQWWVVAAWPKPVWAAAAAVGLLLMLTPMLRQPEAPLLTEISALRSDARVTVPSGRPLDLRLDTTGTDAAQAVHTQIVSSGRKTVWEGRAELNGGRWQTSVHPGLRQGQYWIRILDLKTGEQIREYSLTAQ